MQKITIETKSKKDVIDITDKISSLLKESKNNKGLAHLFLTHTTAALTTADLDPGTDKDILNALTEIVPKLNYRHPHDPSHVPDHILSSLVGTQVLVPFSNNKLVLGTWQRLVLIEFNGPRTREIIVNFI